MAQIVFDAFVDQAHPDRNGNVFVLVTAETHSKKDGDQWVTVGRTHRDVKVSKESGINLNAFGRGDRVHVMGTEKTEVREGVDKNGVKKTFYTLTVWADSITLQGKPAETPPAWEPDPSNIPEDTPF